MASTPFVIFSASAIFEMSALMNFSPLAGFRSRLSERRSVYFPASSRRRCAPTSPAGPGISRSSWLSFPVFGVHRAPRGAALDDLGGLRHRLHGLVLDRGEREPGGAAGGGDGGG